MPKDPQYTRWRELSNPVSHLDPIQPDSPRYQEGHLPPGFVLLLWNGTELIGPRQFKDQAEADDFLYANTEIESFLVVPKP